MNQLPDHVMLMIHQMKALRGRIETENVQLSEVIAKAYGTKGSNQDRINQIGQSIFVLEREGKRLGSDAETVDRP